MVDELTIIMKKSRWLNKFWHSHKLCGTVTSQNFKGKGMFTYDCVFRLLSKLYLIAFGSENASTWH